RPPAALAWAGHPHTAGQLGLADIQGGYPLDDLLGLLRLLQHPSLPVLGGPRAVARRSRRAEGESDPRAQGDSEGPTARLPAPGLSTASDDQGHPASAGNRPDFHPGTGATPRAASRLISKVQGTAVRKAVFPGRERPSGSKLSALTTSS